MTAPRFRHARLARSGCRGLVLLPLLLCGCFEVKDSLTLQPDGSGTVRIVTRGTLQAEQVEMLMARASFDHGGASAYPPASEEQAQRLFPGKEFTVLVNEEEATNGMKVTVDVSFKDVNALLASPYGRLHALSLTREKGALALKAVTGMEGIALTAEGPPPHGELADDLGAVKELQKGRGGLRAEFRVTMPSTITAANGAREGFTVAWTLDRAKASDGAEFVQQAGRLLEAQCSATGLRFSPTTPPRLGLMRFAQVAERVVAASKPVPDSNAVAATARFVPYALHVVRTVDLSGEGGWTPNQAQLIGAVVLPREMEPQSWGKARLEEVLDARGTNLRTLPEAQEAWQHREAMDRAGNDPQPKGNAAELRHPVALRFAPPEWQVQRLQRIKGSIQLQYFGGSQVVKLTNAIPAGWIARPENAERIFMEESQKLLNHPKLSAVGLSLGVKMALETGSATVLALTLGGPPDALLDAQVFDAEGKAWPTFLVRGGDSGERDAQTISIGGQPKPPLSLALVVCGAGASVEVPILLENVALGAK
jgi:hypothetical protein